jgi:hypothetical protein
MASESEIKTAFHSGDTDADDTLSVSEASSALEKLSGKYVDESTIEAACNSLGVSTSKEMDGKSNRTLGICGGVRELWLMLLMGDCRG